MGECVIIHIESGSAGNVDFVAYGSVVYSTVSADTCFRDGVEQSTESFGSQAGDTESSSSGMVPGEEGPGQEKISTWSVCKKK